MTAVLLTGLRNVFVYLAAALILLSLAQAQERELPVPSGEPILTIEGNITVTNSAGGAVFDRAMLEEFGMIAFETTTPWFDGTTAFEGIPAARLMDMVGAEGTEVVAVALNDYRVTIPMADFQELGVILALKRDGDYMPVSEKGPLFIVYPYDSDPQLHSQKYYARSVWQLSRLTVR